MADDAFVPALASTPVARGEVIRRVVRSRNFAWQVATGVAGNIAVHVIIGWLLNVRVGHEACLYQRNAQGGTALSGEVWVDAFLTAFFVCGSQVDRVNDVRKGKLPLIAADAFPRGALALLFFRGSCTRPPSRRDHCTNVASLLTISLVWGGLWGGLTYGLLWASWLSPLGGPARGSFCLGPWAFTAARSGWTAIEAACVVAGSYLLWCTKGEGAKALQPIGALQEPLAQAAPQPAC